MMTSQIEQVFGRERLKMATGDHVEVYREAVAAGERRRYTKRFLATSDADFGQWTEREWRILARLIGHGIRCVPSVVQFDGGAQGGIRLVQTYDAGVTVDQWATLLPGLRDGRNYRHVFEDCAHWWSLAHACIAALDEIHSLGLVHLDIKGDNICIPYGPPSFDPDTGDVLYPIFQRLALIDFAFSVVSGENLATPLPIGWQKDYDYQSPRLLRALDAGRHGDLQPTKDLDWRCDLYSLAAMLRRYLPGEAPAAETGWTAARFDDARTLIFRLRECHDRDIPHWRPHQQLMEYTDARLGAKDLLASLDRGWELALDAAIDAASAPITPMTRIAPSIRVPNPARLVTQPPHGTASHSLQAAARPADFASPPARLASGIHVPTAVTVVRGAAPPAPPRRSRWRATVVVPLLCAFAALAAPSFIGNPERPLSDHVREAFVATQVMLDGARRPGAEGAKETTAQETMPAPTAAAASPPSPTAAPVAVKEATLAAASESTSPVSSATVAAAGPPATPESAPVAERPTASSRGAPPRPKSSPPNRKSSKIAAQPADTARANRPPPPAQIANAKHWRGVSVAAAASPGRPASPPLAKPQDWRQVAPAPVAAPSVDPTALAGLPAPVPAPASVAANDAPSDGRAATSALATTRPATGVTAGSSEEERIATGSPATATPERRELPLVPRQAAPSNAGDGAGSKAQTPANWQTLIASLGKMLGGLQGPAAPVEERRVLPAAPRMEASPSQARPQAPAEIITRPAPEPQSPRIADTAPRGDATAQDPLATQGRRMLADVVPRVAARAQPDVARVLGLAATATQRSQQQAVVEAADSRWGSDTEWIPASDIEPLHARRLHEDARRAYLAGRASEAFNTELRAFAANPRDPNIAAYLAWLHLKTSPMQPELARQLALYAILVSGPQRSMRFSDWNTLAIASALTGHDVDAAKAFLVELAVTSNLDRTCQTALAAYATYGERLRGPVEAMLNRADSSGRISPYCDRRPSWAAAKLQ
ncbi:MAG: hypothetical protein ABI981_04145 [Betaproteobacteria bacterium]